MHYTGDGGPMRADHSLSRLHGTAFEPPAPPAAEGESLQPPAADEAAERDRRRAWLGWGMSAATHALLIALLGSVYFLTRPPDLDAPPVRISVIEAPPPPKTPPPERTLEAVQPL